MKAKLDAILRRSQAEYLDSLTPPRDALLVRMEQFAEEEGHPISDAEVAQLLRVLIRARRPMRVLEVGTNIGYGVVVMGRECEPAAAVETIELNRGTLVKAKAFVADAELPCRVVFHEGAALEVLGRIEDTFDFVYIDCVKTEYGQYLDLLLPHLETGAMIVCDNLLWKGQVAEGAHDASTDALRAFNQRLMSEPRLLTSILPLGDGTGVSVVIA